MVIGVVFVAILLIAGIVTSQSAGRNAQPANPQAYAVSK